MISPAESVVVRTSCQIIIPFMQVFALYCLFHGHYSPGGGFQAGAILGASVILVRLTQHRNLDRFLRGDRALRLGALGVLLYGTVGLLPVLLGGNFLDYGRYAALGWTSARARYWGILGIEVGVALGVCGVMVAIFDALARRGPAKEPA